MPELRDLRGLFPPPRAPGRTPHPQLPRRGENSSEIPTDSPLPRTLRLVTTARMHARRVTRSPTRPGPCPHVLSPLAHPCPRGNSRPSGCSQDPRTWPLLTPCPTPGPRDPCPAQRGDRHESHAERPCRHLAALTLLRAHNSGAGTRRCPHRRTRPRAARPHTVARPRPQGPDMAESSPVSGETSPPRFLTPAGVLGP